MCWEHKMLLQSWCFLFLVTLKHRQESEEKSNYQLQLISNFIQVCRNKAKQKFFSISSLRFELVFMKKTSKFFIFIRHEEIFPTKYYYLWITFVWETPVCPVQQLKNVFYLSCILKMKCQNQSVICSWKSHPPQKAIHKFSFVTSLLASSVCIHMHQKWCLLLTSGHFLWIS